MKHNKFWILVLVLFFSVSCLLLTEKNAKAADTYTSGNWEYAI